MAKVYTFLADGCEMVEALAVVDILRRASVEVVTVSVKKNDKNVLSSHKVKLEADSLFEENDYSDADVLFLPGGMPGTLNLEACKELCEILKKQNRAGKYLSAICAAPSVLGHLSILEGRKATCYPGFEKDLLGATHTGSRVEVSQNIITSRGMGTATDLGLKLVSILVSEQKADEIAHSIQYII